ncbi:MAG: hypothetical protein K2R93_06085 [Gemmatimonadaceae bacterium]|nr:hypothetical protein [Gemmatimonadaceae bacterium]
MSEHDPLDTALPPDLAEIERLLRAPAAAPPPALLSRIEASRDLGVVVERMMLAEEVFAQRTRQRRLLISMASAAVLTIGAFGAWRVLGPHGARFGPTEELRGASAAPPAAAAPSTASEVSRLLQPWPSVAHAQAPARGDGIRAPGAPLEPSALARVAAASRMYRRIQRADNGRILSDTRFEVRLDSSETNGTARWILTTRIPDDAGSGAIEIDSIVLDRRTLLPVQRRLHGRGFNRYYRFTPLQLVGTDTLADQFFNASPLAAQPLGFSPGPRSLYWFKALNPRGTLVLSEAHLALLMRTYPLWVGWSMPIEVLSSLQTRYRDGSTGAIQLRVASLDTLPTNDGRVPAYRLEINYGGRRPELWWIGAANGELLRTSRMTPPGPVVTEVTSLESIQPVRR